MARGSVDRGIAIRNRNRQSRAAWVAACVAAGAIATGCVPSLGAVRTTAGLGMQLSSYETVFDLAVTYCHYTDYINAPDPRCAGLESDLENWRSVNRALVGYAAALNAMADDMSDRSHQDTIATALGATVQLGQPFSTVIDANITSGVSTGVSTLIAGILGVYRREKLGSTIRDSDDALQAVARGISENITLLDRADQNLIMMIRDTMSSVQIGSSPAADRAGITMSLSSVQNELAAHRSYLSSYKAAIESFAKAHNQIRKKLKGLGDKKADLELLRLIASDVATITRSVKTAITRPPPPPPPTP
jgi:hypothetical protein